ncbi:MAG: hypothetical protein ACLSB9_38240 [Hydrogeniiclostridium mannosilyticum]
MAGQSAVQQFFRVLCPRARGEEQDLCMITGAADVVCDMHPKGVLA